MRKFLRWWRWIGFLIVFALLCVAFLIQHPLFQQMAMLALLLVTLIYAFATHEISRATTKQAEATVALASREYVKEFIRLEIHPLLKRCTDIKKTLDLDYFGHDYETGWPEIYGLPSELAEEEAQVLNIGTHEGRKVFSYPDPSLGILQGRYYLPPDTSVWLRLQDLEDEHKEIADRIAGFDSEIPQLDKLLRSVAIEIKKLVAPYVSNLERERSIVVNSELDKRRFVSYIAEICFNYLLLTPKDFDAFFKQFERDQAKNFWEENKPELQTLLNKEQVSEKVNRLQELSNRLLKELTEICDSLEASEKKYRRQCYITFKELPPFFSS